MLGTAAIDVAAWAGQEAAVTLLVQLGAHGPANDCEGGNPLHYPTMTPTLVIWLAQSGCDVNGINAEHGPHTPLTTALRQDDLEVARALLEARADPSLERAEVDGELFAIATTAVPCGMAWEALQSIGGARLLEEFGGRFAFSDPAAFEDVDPMLAPIFVDALSTMLLREQNDVARWVFEHELGLCETRFGRYLALAIAADNTLLHDRLVENGARISGADLEFVMTALLQHDPKNIALGRLAAHGVELPDLGWATPPEQKRIHGAFRSGAKRTCGASREWFIHDGKGAPNHRR